MLVFLFFKETQNETREKQIKTDIVDGNID